MNVDYRIKYIKLNNIQRFRSRNLQFLLAIKLDVRTISIYKQGPLEQRSARFPVTEEVTGSNPVWVAKRVEARSVIFNLVKTMPDLQNISS